MDEECYNLWIRSVINLCVACVTTCGWGVSQLVGSVTTCGWGVWMGNLTTCGWGVIQLLGGVRYKLWMRSVRMPYVHHLGGS